MKIFREPTVLDDLRKLYGQPLSTKVKFYWRRAWTKMPEVLSLTPLVGFSLVVLGYTMYRSTYDCGVPQYFNRITIYRPDDPRVSTIRTDGSLRNDNYH